MMSNNDRHTASFRDPSGFLFRKDGVLYRQINQLYQENYDRLMQSGLYKKLVDQGWMVRHEEAQVEPAEPSICYRVIKPELVEFISYPYEWSFSQLKDAALATLKIQKMALEAGMSLKDSSAYNIQFYKGKPVLIDTLSFEVYKEGQPWVAYRQFCQHFLAPIALMALVDIRLGQLSKTYIDGVPLDLASELLPFKTKLNFALTSHIHMHAAAQKRYADKQISGQSATAGKVSRMAFMGLIDSLESAVKSLQWKPAGTEWAQYYEITNYSDEAFEFKRQTVSNLIDKVHPAKVWDLGANTGEFSRCASNNNIPTVAFDIDPAAVEQNYRLVKEKKEKFMLPLILDLTNPSPALGWANTERDSLSDRGPTELILALAIIHHLVISNNVPMSFLSSYLSSLTEYLVIEFVPKSDSQVQKLLASREDIFPDYNRESFEKIFSEDFVIKEAVAVKGSDRYIYLMERRF
jgi:hypothetical protein